MTNYHNSWIHRLPPEILATVASHLKDNASLVVATHACHLWRATLLASPRLWSHLDFENEERALVFLERSKSSPLRVDLTGVYSPSEIVRESLNGVATRVAMLWAMHDCFLDELWTQPMSMLETLEITEPENFPPKRPIQCLPALTSFVVTGFDRLRFRTPLLTSFHLTHDPTIHSVEWTVAILLDFLRSCPLLEVAFF